MQEHGADLTATNNEGQTAMSLAVGVGNKNGKFTVIDFQWLSFGSFRTASKPKLPRNYGRTFFETYGQSFKVAKTTAKASGSPRTC